MKICDLTQAYHATSGGIKTYLSEKRKFLAGDERNSHVLIVPGEEDRIEEKKGRKVYHVKGIQLPNYKSYRFIVRMDKILKILLKEKPDLVELGSVYLMPYPAFYYRKAFKKPVVGFYHTDFPECYVKPYLQKHFKKENTNSYLRIAEKYNEFIFKNCDQVIASTPKFYRKLHEMDVKRLQLVPLGVDLELFNPARRDENLRREWLREGEKAFIYAGRLDEEKRISVLLGGIEKASPSVRAKFIIIGDGPGREKVARKAREMNNVIYLPYEQDRNQLSRYLASADFYMTAGPHETFGLSIIEAQACGLPVLGVKAGALIDRVDEHCGLLVSPDDPDKFAGGIISLMNSTECEKMGELARITVQRKYSWGRTFDSIVKLYRDNIYEKKKA